MMKKVLPRASSADHLQGNGDREGRICVGSVKPSRRYLLEDYSRLSEESKRALKTPARPMRIVILVKVMDAGITVDSPI